jgi:MFS family permease
MEPLWSKSFVQMTLSMLFLFTGFYLLLPTMPLFIKELGGTESQVGLAAGMFTLAAVVFRPLVGGLLDRYGRKPFIIWGLLCFALAMYAYSWVAMIVVLMLLRVLHGVSWAFSTTAVGTAITDIIPVSRRGEGMGWYGMSMTVAMAIGPMLGIWIMQQYSFSFLFLIATALSVGSLLLALRIPLPFERKSGSGKMSFFDRSVLSATVTVFFLAVAYGGITTFLPLFAATIQVNAGTFFLVYAVVLTVTRPVAGKLTDRYGEATFIIPALLITVVALLALGFTGGWTGLIASAILFGVGFGSAQPALQAATLRIAHPERRGVANASFFTAFDLGIGLGAILLGAISEFTSYQTLFLVSSASVLVSLLCFSLFVRGLLKRKEEPLTT